MVAWKGGPTMGRLGRGSCFGRRANSSGALVLIGETYPLDTLIAGTRASRFASVGMPRVCMHVCVCVWVCVGVGVNVCGCGCGVEKQELNI